MLSMHRELLQAGTSSMCIMETLTHRGVRALLWALRLLEAWDCL